MKGQLSSPLISRSNANYGVGCGRLMEARQYLPEVGRETC
jgi:hypothetical protein